jgi:hypothetical protein
MTAAHQHVITFSGVVLGGIHLEPVKSIHLLPLFHKSIPNGRRKYGACGRAAIP